MVPWRWKHDGDIHNMQVGLLIEVGKEVMPPSAVQSVLESQDRTKLARIARSAPPNGLYLMSVLYDESLLVPAAGAPKTSYGRWQQSTTCSRIEKGWTAATDIAAA